LRGAFRFAFLLFGLARGEPFLPLLIFALIALRARCLSGSQQLLLELLPFLLPALPRELAFLALGFACLAALRSQLRAELGPGGACRTGDCSARPLLRAAFDCGRLRDCALNLDRDGSFHGSGQVGNQAIDGTLKNTALRHM